MSDRPISRRTATILTLTLAGGALLVQGVRAQVASPPPRFDPFNPEASLGASTESVFSPATQPGSGRTPIVGRGRTIIRDPFRAPRRSPFRP